tara:strand:- start:1256 stop:1771 length:516 start_codon:yes stop_codon:yes gene_type:complete
MTFFKDIMKQVKSMPVLFCGVVVLVLALLIYNSQKGISLSGMTNDKQVKDSNSHELDEKELSDPAEVTMSSGTPGCINREVSNPEDLLPKSANSSELNNLAPVGEGDFQNVNLLKAGHHAGIDTVGGTLRNANLQLRSEPPNPQEQVSPWLNTTIKPDLMRIPLELGCGPQ